MQLGGEQGSAETPSQALHFTLPGIQFFIGLEQVLRVLPFMALTPVPQAPPYLRGLMNLGGRSFPVIDLAARIELPESIRYTTDTPILLCTDGNRTAGLIVESVVGVKEMSLQDMQMRPLLDPSDTPVLGVVDSSEGLALHLDLGRVLAIDLREPALDRRASDRPGAYLQGGPGDE